MRKVVLDTETTGLDPSQGHRVIEIGALEIINRRQTGKTFHVYLNPEREIDVGAMAVHGITNEFVADKPRFAEVADAFLDFVRGAELVIHNAPFDVGFLNAELKRLDESPIHTVCTVLDTLRLAKDMHPGQKNNLDALCKRYQVDNTGRAFHGALLDAQLLAEVYLGMTRGQESLGIDTAAPRPGTLSESPPTLRPARLRVVKASAEERERHTVYLDGMTKDAGKALSW